MDKKIIILGGSGFIGRKLSLHLKQSGYDVIIFSRNPEIATIQLPEFQHVKWDSAKPELWNYYINDAFAVINFAGASIGGGRWTKKYKEEILNSRLTVTNALVEEILKAQNPPKVFINASGVDYYGNTGNSEVDESSPAGTGFLAEVCRFWENEALKASAKTRVVLARMGVVLDKEALAVKRMILPFKLFIGGPLGTGRQWFPWIHIDDAVEMYKWVLVNPDIQGPVNFVSPQQVTMKEFSKEMGKALHRPSIFRVPECMLRIAVGESADMIVNSKKVLPSVALEKDYKYKFKELEEAFTNLLH